VSVFLISVSTNGSIPLHGFAAVDSCRTVVLLFPANLTWSFPVVYDRGRLNYFFQKKKKAPFYFGRRQPSEIRAQVDGTAVACLGSVGWR